MPDTTIKTYLDQLRQVLPCVPPVPVRSLKALHRKRDYEGMVRLIKRTMNVEVRLVVGWVNSGGPKGFDDAPAWVRTPTVMPYYGTAAFKEMTIKMFIRKSFLERSTYGQAAIAIAHELSHVVLDSIQHPLRKEEKAVDLTAMLLGFSHLYESACYTVERVDFHNNATWRQLGYLTPGELQAASRILVPFHLRATHTLRTTARRYRRVLILWGILGALACIGAVQKEWQLHQTVLAQQGRLQSQLPLRVNDYVTLVDVRAGLASLTRTFSLTMPLQNVSAFENSVRRNVCGVEAAHIKDGISYTNEYRDASGDLVARIEIASCP